VRCYTNNNNNYYYDSNNLRTISTCNITTVKKRVISAITQESAHWQSRIIQPAHQILFNHAIHNDFKHK